MIFFIPAWYQKNKWCENEQSWYARRTHTEFDDTVKQVQLFHRSKVHPYKIMLLGFAPNFRHFLHRQSVYHAPYWSCFDAIQEIRRKKAMLLSFHNLNWPEGIEFIYSNFVILAMYHGEKYAQIEFGEDGNPIQVDMFQNNILKRRNIYDDRGFLSSTVLYEDGKMLYQDYLRDDGVWKLREYASDGHVEVNPRASEYLISFDGEEETHPFLNQRYDSMQKVIGEVVEAYVKLADPGDMFCIAMDGQHLQALDSALQGRKRILSFYENRLDRSELPKWKSMIESADYVVVDSEENEEEILGVTDRLLTNIKDISPYDSRVDYSISGQLNVQKILVPVDALGQNVLDELLEQLAGYLTENENARVHLFTRRADYDMESRLLRKAQEVLDRMQLPTEWARKKSAQNAENELDAEQNEPVKFVVEQCVDEISVSKCIREQRILVDFSLEREIYLQIAAVSVGIPQIVCRKTKYVEHGKNGFVLQNTKDIRKSLVYYLSGMKYWNESLIYSRELSKDNSTAVLIREWKEVIERIG